MSGRRATGWRRADPGQSRLPSPALLGKVARSAGWGVTRYLNPSRIARASARTYIDSALLSAPHPALRATLCPEIVTESTNGRSLEQPPVAGPEPVATTDETCGEARDRSGVFLNPNSCMGVRARTSKEGSGSMPTETRIVGLDVAKSKVGAAPYDDDSGERKGVRRIKGGRRKLRNLLYMPVMGAATQHNPVLKAYYQRLRARGKEAKVALIACMRKLIVILNTMLARDQTWSPPERPA